MRLTKSQLTEMVKEVIQEQQVSTDPEIEKAWKHMMVAFENLNELGNILNTKQNKKLLKAAHWTGKTKLTLQKVWEILKVMR